MNNKPLISVVMSVYNGAEYLNEAIKSILDQNYSNLEFIMINDGSTDNSFEIMSSFDDDRIIIIDQENKGLTKSLNIGVAKAKGEYIARQDADDISLTDRFENFLKYQKRNTNVDIYSTPAFIIDENGEVKKTIPNYFRRNGFSQELLNYSNSMIHGTLIVKADIIKEYKYNEEFRYSQDFELYHRLIYNGYNISYDDSNISYQLRIHKNSISRRNREEQIVLWKRILESRKIKLHDFTTKNRIYFKLIDVFFYIKKKLAHLI